MELLSLCRDSHQKLDVILSGYERRKAEEGERRSADNDVAAVLQTLKNYLREHDVTATHYFNEQQVCIDQYDAELGEKLAELIEAFDYPAALSLIEELETLQE